MDVPILNYIATKLIIGLALYSLVGGPSKMCEGSGAQIQGAIGALVRRAINNGDIRRDLEPFRSAPRTYRRFQRDIRS